MSKFLRLDHYDALKAVIVAALTAFLTSVLQYLQAGSLPTREQVVSAWIAGLAAGVSYLVKNIFTNSKGEIVTPESLLSK